MTTDPHLNAGDPEPDNEFADMSEQDFEIFLADAIDDWASENEAPEA